MIRRDVRLADGSPAWALISQIEHARLSAELAERCVGRFSAPELEAVRREVLLAIARHDDGWVEWEESPRIDAEHGRPVSFMELETDEAIDIWNRSIERSAAYGPLAGWLVAGHFIRLTDKYSDHSRTDSAAAKWRTEMDEQRSAWSAEWQAINPPLHTRALADEALQWLWTFDEASLWFCCTSPADEESSSTSASTSKPAVIGRGTPLEMMLTASGAGVAIANPWRFDQPTIELELTAQIIPAIRYDSPETLLAAGESRTLRWQLGTSEV